MTASKEKIETIFSRGAQHPQIFGLRCTNKLNYSRIMNDDEITIVGGDAIFFGDNQQQSQSNGYTPIKPSLNPRSKLPANNATNKGVFVPQYRESTNFIPKTTPTTPYVPHVPKVSSQTPYTPYVPHVPNTFVPETNFNTSSHTQPQQHQTSFIPTPEIPQQQQQNSPFIPNMNTNTPFVPVMPLRQQTSSSSNMNIGNGMANNDPLNFNKVPEVLKRKKRNFKTSQIIISIKFEKKMNSHIVLNASIFLFSSFTYEIIIIIIIFL